MLAAAGPPLEGLRHNGGKLDDTTVVVAMVMPQSPGGASLGLGMYALARDTRESWSLVEDGTLTRYPRPHSRCISLRGIYEHNCAASAVGVRRGF